VSELDAVWGNTPRTPADVAWRARTNGLLRNAFAELESAPRLEVVEVDEADSHSWQPVDLVALGLDPPSPPTIAGLIYPGRRHIVSGEPETLKTWLALVACADEIRAGSTVVYADFENGGASMLERLRALRLSDHELERFLYLAPEEPMTDPSILADVRALLVERQPSLVVFDSYTAALSLHDLDPNSGVEVERFGREVIAPIQDVGAAFLALDHLPKAREGRGKFAIGSERKVAGTDVHLGLEAVQPFGRGKSGLARVITHKDRPGHLSRPRAAELELTSDAETGSVTWTFRQPREADDDAGGFRPTRLMEKVSRFVEAHVPEETPSRKAVEEAVTGKATFVRQAMDVLLAEDFIAEEPGPRNARLLRSLRPYRAADDDVS
jgi:hypothetical protein